MKRKEKSQKIVKNGGTGKKKEGKKGEKQKEKRKKKSLCPQVQFQRG